MRCLKCKALILLYKLTYLTVLFVTFMYKLKVQDDTSANQNVCISVRRDDQVDVKE